MCPFVMSTRPGPSAVAAMVAAAMVVVVVVVVGDSVATAATVKPRTRLQGSACVRAIEVVESAPRRCCWRSDVRRWQRVMHREAAA